MHGGDFTFYHSGNDSVLHKNDGRDCADFAFELLSDVYFLEVYAELIVNQISFILIYGQAVEMVGNLRHIVFLNIVKAIDATGAGV